MHADLFSIHIKKVYVGTVGIAQIQYGGTVYFLMCTLILLYTQDVMVIKNGMLREI